jgi:catechol 2,3-dioxygenase-like lactoylglutathione lyase family enzyme
MAIRGVNHAVLYVRDADRSAEFFVRLLGFHRLDDIGEMPRVPGAAFLRAEKSFNDHDLGLFSIGEAALATTAGMTSVGMYHLSWEVETLSDLARYAEALSSEGFLTGASNHGTTRAIYARDPDGLEFELTWIMPAELITAADAPTTKVLNLASDIARFGAETPSRTTR